MRLLKRSPNGDIELESHRDDNIPPYAILSHTWSDDQEVSYEELLAGQGKDKAGYAKMRFCADKAAADGLEYFWVDTCCIDKSSSSELSESINSMYRWYQNADICYAYIGDWRHQSTWAELVSVIDFHEKKLQTPEQSEDKPHHDMRQNTGTGDTEGKSENEEGNEKEEIKLNPAMPGDFICPLRRTNNIVSKENEEGGWKHNHRVISGLPSVQSKHNAGDNHSLQQKPKLPDKPSSEGVPLRWFTRGWTLQELIAPKKMEFFDANWKSRGMKSDRQVVDNLSRITGIAPSVLRDSSGHSLREICHGQRMSWAAYRETTRKEDIAYSLLGIFDIHMSLLYGEGEKAFTRLQEKILKSSTDLSLLAWTQTLDDPQQHRAIFSRHPREFAKLSRCRLDDSQFRFENEVVMTNKGARTCTGLFRKVDCKGNFMTSTAIGSLALGCYVDGSQVGIHLKSFRNFYLRAHPDALMRLNDRMKRDKPRAIYLARHFDTLSSLDSKKNMAIELVAPDPYDMMICTSFTQGYYDYAEGALRIGHLNDFIGGFMIDVTECVPKDGKCCPRMIGQFMAIVSKAGPSNVYVNFVIGDEIESLKAQMRMIRTHDSETAHKNLAARIAGLQGVESAELALPQHDTPLALRISGDIIGRGQEKQNDHETCLSDPPRAIRISIEPKKLAEQPVTEKRYRDLHPRLSRSGRASRQMWLLAPRFLPRQPCFFLRPVLATPGINCFHLSDPWSDVW